MRIATSKFSPTRSTNARGAGRPRARSPDTSRTKSASSGASTMVGHVARHRHAQAAARLDLPVLGERFGRRHVLDEMMRVLEHRAAEVGDGELARRAQQQALAKLGFKRGDPSRHGRLGQFQSLRGAREAAFVDDAGEQQQVIGFEAHRRFGRGDRSMGGTMLSKSMASARVGGTNIFASHHPNGANDEHPADQFQRPPRSVPFDAPRHSYRRAAARRRSRSDAYRARSQPRTRTRCWTRRRSVRCSRPPASGRRIRRHALRWTTR